METIDENELRLFLKNWEVGAPGDALVERTMFLMREELAKQVQSAPATLPIRQHPWFMAIIGLALLLTVNLFYMLTLGSILRMTLPPTFTTYLSHSLVAFSAAEFLLIAGTIMVFFFKQIQLSGARMGENRMAHGVH